MRCTQALGVPVAFLLVIASASAQPAETEARISMRRVPISLGFSGEQLFVTARAAEGTTQVVAVVEAPSHGPLRLMKKGRVGIFWLGTRQYEVDGLPGLYIVNVSCPDRERASRCESAAALARVNAVLKKVGVAVGLGALAERAEVKVSREPYGTAVTDDLLVGFWELQESRGLYKVNASGARLSPDGLVYHSVSLPPAAPEGKYKITTYFLSDSAFLGADVAHLFVHKDGILAWLHRFAAKERGLYGVFTLFVVLFSGWLAAVLFETDGGH